MRINIFIFLCTLMLLVVGCQPVTITGNIKKGNVFQAKVPFHWKSGKVEDTVYYFYSPRGALSVGVFYESTPELMDCRTTKFKDLYCAKYGSEGKKLFIKKYSVEKWSGSIISFFEPSETIEIWLLQNGNYGLVMVSQYEKKNIKQTEDVIKFVKSLKIIGLSNESFIK